MIKHFPAFTFLRSLKRSGERDAKKFAWNRVSRIGLGDQIDWQSLPKRDFYLTAFRALQIIEILGFEDYFDHESRVLLSESRSDLHDHVHGEDGVFTSMVHLFGWTNEPEHYNFKDEMTTSKQSLVQSINGILKRIGRKVKRVRKRGSEDPLRLESLVTFEFNDVDEEMRRDVFSDSDDASELSFDVDEDADSDL